MNEQTKGLITAVVNNDIRKAKQLVKIILEKDKTKKDKYFRETVKRKLQTSSTNYMELPHNIKDILHMEDVSVSFNENRYFLSERENKTYNEIYNMHQTSRKLSEMGIQYLNSVMLYGESGTGKTLFGKYVAYKLGIPFVYMNFSNAISSYLGSTAKNIAKAFEFVEQQKCVFMLDEVDAIGMVRGKEDVGEMARITIALMQAFDCVKNDTIIIGATNRIDMIDVALLRRFNIKHNVLKFTEIENEQMIVKFLDDVNIIYDIENIRTYSNKKLCPAIVINDVIRSIARHIETEKPFTLLV